MSKFVSVGVALCVSLMWSVATHAEEQKIALPVGAQKAILVVPDGWTHRDHQAIDNAMTLKVSSPEEKVVLLVTILFLPAPPELDVPGVVVEMNKENAVESLEQSCEPNSLKPADGAGAYCAFTDKDLADVDVVPAGQFKYVSAGLVIAKGLVVNFTILTNDVEGADYARALGVMSGVTVTDSLSAAPTPATSSI